VQHLARIESAGVTLLELREGVVVRAGWTPVDFASEHAGADLGLFALGFRERLQQSGKRSLWVWGPEDLRLQFEAALGGIEMRVWHPSDLPGVALVSPELAGLLLQGSDRWLRGVQFRRDVRRFPAWTKRAGFLFEPKKAFTVAALLLVLVLGTAFWTAGYENGLYRTLIGNSEKIAGEVKGAEANRDILREYQRERDNTLEVLKAITEAMPNEVYLDQLRIDERGSVQMMGKAKAFSNAEELAANLNRHDLFSKATTQRMGTEQKGVTFSLSCSLTNPRRLRNR